MIGHCGSLSRPPWPTWKACDQHWTRRSSWFILPEIWTVRSSSLEADMTSSVVGSRRTTGVLLLVCLVQFMDVVDAAILNVALPSIERSLDFTQQSLQWVISGYLVSYGGFLLLGGRAGDLLGPRRMLVTGTALFGLFSLCGALAPSSGTLVIARIAQGVGAALMAPAGLSILTRTFQ